MRAALLLALAGLLVGCQTRSLAEPDRLHVTVERARTEAGYQPPVFRWDAPVWDAPVWDAPVAARLTVYRGTDAGRVTIWEVAEGDRQGAARPAHAAAHLWRYVFG